MARIAHMASDSRAAWRNLALATLSMALAFAAWGLISSFAPAFRAELGLDAQATAFVVAVPVLLGSLARIPMVSAGTGRVLQGSPPRPLPRIRLEVRGDEIVAVGFVTEGE